jgi:hypothetical protein
MHHNFAEIKSYHLYSESSDLLNFSLSRSSKRTVFDQNQIYHNIASNPHDLVQVAYEHTGHRPELNIGY